MVQQLVRKEHQLPVKLVALLTHLLPSLVVLTLYYVRCVRSPELAIHAHAHRWGRGCEPLACQIERNEHEAKRQI